MQELGFGISATKGTAAHLQAAGIPCSVVLKIQEGRPNAGDLIKNGDIAMMLITSTGHEPDVRDGKNLRRLSLGLKVGAATALMQPRSAAHGLRVGGGRCHGSAPTCPNTLVGICTVWAGTLLCA